MFYTFVSYTFLLQTPTKRNQEVLRLANVEAIVLAIVVLAPFAWPPRFHAQRPVTIVWRRLPTKTLNIILANGVML